MRQLLRRKRIMQGLALLLAAAFLSAGTWGIWRWATYPEVPDVAAVEVEQSLAFIGTDEFNRMLEGHRERYVMAVIERLREKSFDELLAMMQDRSLRDRRIGRNLRDLSNREEIRIALTELFIDKFYEEPKLKRDLYLTAAVLMERRAVNRNPERFNLPQPDAMKAAMSEFTSRTPPRVQAQISQLMLDMQKRRQALGLPDPWQ